MYTRESFERMRLRMAKKMAADKKLQKKAIDLLVKADRYNWVHQTNWFGEPILNLPQDMFALQEIIYKTRPEYIIEVGVAWGGSLLFYSTLMEVLGGKKIIGIDIYMPKDLKKRLLSHGKLSERLILINASSIEKSTIEEVKKILGESKKTLIILDSFHTHEHVLKELRLYSQFVGKGYYIVCSDTIIEDIPVQKHRPRPWGPGNNPKTAVWQFLKENRSFGIDRKLENKLLLSCNPEGYLIRRK
uniref:Cephalosporin hydroxylase n=1 Tax=candidate division CPR3 bacterium TaxID=2268181 RepID=A0A7V3N5Q8_UNCC3